LKNKKLLLIKVDAIGDYILFRNFIKVLATSEKYKSYDIDFICNISCYELSMQLDKNFISNFYSFDTTNFIADEWYKYSLIQKLNFNAYNCIIHPTFSRNSFVDKLISKINAKEKIGSIGDLQDL